MTLAPTYYTLRFPDYATAKAACQSLGYWRDPEPIYEYQPTGETEAQWVYANADGEEFLFNYEPSPQRLADEGDPELVEIRQAPIMANVQVGLTPEGPITDGQIHGPDGVRGFSIAVIGQDPTLPDGTTLDGYYVNVAGLLPAAVASFMVEYGCAGLRFAE